MCKAKPKNCIFIWDQQTDVSRNSVGARQGKELTHNSTNRYICRGVLWKPVRARSSHTTRATDTYVEAYCGNPSGNGAHTQLDQQINMSRRTVGTRQGKELTHNSTNSYICRGVLWEPVRERSSHRGVGGGLPQSDRWLDSWFLTSGKSRWS